MELVERRLAWPGLGLGGIRHRATAWRRRDDYRAVLAADHDLGFQRTTLPADNTARPTTHESLKSEDLRSRGNRSVPRKYQATGCRMLARSLTFMGITSASALSLSATSTASDVVSRYRPSLPSYVARGGVAVVTGGNSGIGAESAKALLDAGCFVVLACRDEAAGEQALSEMGAAAGSARVQKLDLADLDSVSAACSEIAAKEGRISLLLNNAGVMATPQEKTKQGFELQIGTNHLGHFALTRLLLPLLEVSSGV